MLGHYIKMSQAVILGVVVLMMCSSSSSAMLMMGGGGSSDPAPASDPAPPPCERGKSFDAQTGSFTCSSIDDFKPEKATWWGTWINSSVPISSEEATAAGMSHTFHTLSSSPTKKQYIAMRKTDQHCKMVQFDITKSGDTCSYSINDAGYAGYGGGGMGATEACTATTDAEVIAKWNAKSPVASARTAATDEGYGLKSLGYSLYC
jgi:hypothetical protein